MGTDGNPAERGQVRHALELGNAAEEEHVGQHRLVGARERERIPRVVGGRVLLASCADHLRVVTAELGTQRHRCEGAARRARFLRNVALEREQQTSQLLVCLRNRLAALW